MFTRALGLVGMLVAALIVISALNDGRIFRALVGLLFFAIASYWVFTRNKQS
jgi:hypothetical protein